MNIAIIPMRKGSKGIPGKHLKNFNNKPLVIHILLRLINSKKLDEIIIATDDLKIKEIVDSYFGDKIDPRICFFDRRGSLDALDHSSTEEVIYNLKFRLKDEDTCILIQATNPFNNFKDIDEALSKYQGKGSILSVSHYSRFFWNRDSDIKNWKLKSSYNYKNRPRRQDYFNKNFIENGAFYIFNFKEFRKSFNRLNDPIELYIMKDHTYVELDDIWDWELAEFIFSKKEVV